MNRARFAEILRLLAANDVEFVVVGMTAGILHGAPVTTIDLDVVHRRSPENVARLLRVLGELDAFYRHDPRQLRPEESHLGGPGHQLLVDAVRRPRLPRDDRRGQGLRRAASAHGRDATLGRVDDPRAEPARADRSQGARRPRQGPRGTSCSARHPRRAPAALAATRRPGSPGGSA